jgi:hypothetical protein
MFQAVTDLAACSEEGGNIPWLLSSYFFFLPFFGFGGRPTPGEWVSQFGCLHFGQRTGLP